MATSLQYLAVRLTCAVGALLVLASCDFRFPMGRGERGRRFESPLPALSDTNLDVPEIRAMLAGRRTSIKSLRANLDLTAGGESVPGRQQVVANVVMQLPDFVRVRGSMSAGTIFDLLLDKQKVRIVMYPERQYFDGSLGQLEANPRLLAGIYPQELISHFTVEQVLLKRLEKSSAPHLTSDRGHYVLRFDRPNAVSEYYWLRKRDLLVEQYQQISRDQVVSSIKYWGYALYGGQHLLPSKFTVELVRTGGRFSATVTEMRVNEPVPSQLRKLALPDGFSRMATEQ